MRRRWVGGVGRLLRGRRLPVGRELTLAALVREHVDSGIKGRGDGLKGQAWGDAGR